MPTYYNKVHLITCAEFLVSKKNGHVEYVHSKDRQVCFATRFNIEDGLRELRAYQRAYREKYCKDDLNGTVVEFRLLFVSSIENVSEEMLDAFQVTFLTPDYYKRLTEGD